MELRKYQYNHLNNQHNTPFHVQANQTSSLTSIKQSISEMEPFVLIGICFGAVILLTIIVVICCKKYHNRHLYQQSPENFSNKPSLSLKQVWRYKEQIKSLTDPKGHSILRKQTYDGKYIQVTFKTNQNCIYFPNELRKDCYFQIEAVKLSSVVQIGFVHVEDLGLICKNVAGECQINLDQYGVSVRTDGSTYIYGNHQLNFGWKIEYGDTLGIGLTQHDGGRRVWITRNGIIQNPPTTEQMVKYIDIDTIKDNDKTTVQKKKVSQQEDDQEEEKKYKIEAEAAKKRIQMKTSRKFKYFAVIISESPLEPRRQTVLNWNVGGQSFRLYDAKELVGLLR